MQHPLAARDAGLVRALGVRALAANVVNIMVGAGIFIVPATMAGAVGPDAIWVYAGCALAMGAITLAFAEASSRAPSSGGPYGFVSEALGPFWGYMAGALNWASIVIAAGGIAAAAADTIAAAHPAFAGGTARAALIVGWFALLAAINIGGVGGAARIVELSALVKIAPLAVFVGVGLSAPAAAAPVAPVADGGGFAQAAILGLFLFTGMEGALGVSGEVRDPARTIPRALGLGLLAASALFVAVHLVAERALGATLATSTSPIADALAPVSPALAGAMLAAAAVSMALWLASDALSSPRTLFALARDGLLPPVLGRLHPRTRAPAAAILVHVAIAAALALTGGFTSLAIISTLVIVGVYVLGCIAAVVLRRRRAALAGPPVVIAGMPVAAALGVAAMAWLSTQATPREAAAIGALLVLLALPWLLRRRAR